MGFTGKKKTLLGGQSETQGTIKFFIFRTIEILQTCTLPVNC